jgi:NTE family protein
MLIRLFAAPQMGQFSSDPFRQWLEGALREVGVTGLSDVGRNDPERELKVVVSNVTRSQMLVLPGHLPAEYAALPGSLRVRELRYRTEVPGFLPAR